MARMIYCEKCGINLGELRDATLRKGAVFICADCNAKSKVNHLEKGFSEVAEMLKGFRN